MECVKVAVFAIKNVKMVYFSWKMDSIDAAAPHGCGGTPETSLYNVGYCARGDLDNGSIVNVGYRLEQFLPAALPLGECAGNCKDDSQCGDGLRCWMRTNDDPHPPGCPGIPFGNWNYCVAEDYVSDAPSAAPSASNAPSISKAPTIPIFVRRRKLNTKSTKLRTEENGRELRYSKSAKSTFCYVQHNG